jgi:hypothetical protein
MRNRLKSQPGHMYTIVSSLERKVKFREASNPRSLILSPTEPENNIGQPSEDLSKSAHVNCQSRLRIDIQKESRRKTCDSHD